MLNVCSAAISRGRAAVVAASAEVSVLQTGRDVPFQLTEQQRMLVQSVRELVRDVVAPRAAEIDESRAFPWDVVDVFRRQGYIGMELPQEYGGGGFSLFDSCLVYGEIARACLTSSVTLADQKLGADPIVRAGSPELKRRFMPAIASGEVLIAFALTEPSAGSDVASLRTRAVRRGDRYVLNGRKCFITNGGVAGLYSVFATTDPDRGRQGISCFVVPKDTPGFQVGKLEKKMGIRASPTAELIFDDCAVPAENLIGREGDGFKLAMQALDPARVVVAFQAVGLADGALEQAQRYVADRVQFGRPVGQFQGVQFMLADMAIQTDAARYLAYAAAAAYDHRLPNQTRLAAEAKTFASDAAMRVTTDAVQLLGGYGYIQDFPVERMMRDAKILQIFDGTNQIQRIVIARELSHSLD